MTMKVAVLSLFCFAVATALPAMDLTANSQDMVDYINSLNTTWKAAINRNYQGMSEDYFKGLCGVKTGGPSLPYKDIEPFRAIPESFDARTEWPNCPSISDIRDQGSCGSCWAVAAAEAISDRICIGSKGKVSVNISAEDLMSCCKTCGNGCEGGFPEAAWRYWEEDGLVTGGQYGTKQGCQPYLIAHCSHHEPGKYPDCAKGMERTPPCKKTCEASYSIPYAEDKHKGKSAYAVRRNVEEIQTEIMTNGPVEAGFTVFADFPTYRSGVYQSKSRKALGGHAVRILGWGTEAGTPYWLIANSWNEWWGDNGYFKMIRGKNDCGIEAGIVGGLPRTDN